MMTSTTTWAKKTKKKTKKLKELSLLERKEKTFKQRIKATSFVFFLVSVFVFSPNQDGGPNLKALYTGRYQQTKEQGVKRRAQRMARPRPTPLPEGSTQNMAREEIRLKSSVQEQTGHRLKRVKRRHGKQKDEGELSKSEHHCSLCCIHVDHNSTFPTRKEKHNL